MMNGVNNVDDTHCSVISMIKKGFEILKRFVIKKPIQLVDDSAIPVIPNDDIPVIHDGNIL